MLTCCLGSALGTSASMDCRAFRAVGAIFTPAAANKPSLGRRKIAASRPSACTRVYFMRRPALIRALYTGWEEGVPKDAHGAGQTYSCRFAVAVIFALPSLPNGTKSLPVSTAVVPELRCTMLLLRSANGSRPMPAASSVAASRHAADATKIIPIPARCAPCSTRGTRSTPPYVILLWAGSGSSRKCP